MPRVVTLSDPSKIHKNFSFTLWISFFFFSFLWSPFPTNKTFENKCTFLFDLSLPNQTHYAAKFMSLIASAYSLPLQFPPMAAVTSLSFSALSQCSERKLAVPSARPLGFNSEAFRFRTNILYQYVGVRASNSTSRMVIQCMSSATGAYTFTSSHGSNYRWSLGKGGGNWTFWTSCYCFKFYKNLKF